MKKEIKYKDMIVILLLIQIGLLIFGIIFNSEFIYIIGYILNIICMVLAVITSILKK